MNWENSTSSGMSGQGPNKIQNCWAESHVIYKEISFAWMSVMIHLVLQKFHQPRLSFHKHKLIAALFCLLPQEIKVFNVRHINTQTHTLLPYLLKIAPKNCQKPPQISSHPLPSFQLCSAVRIHPLECELKTRLAAIWIPEIILYKWTTVQALSKS